MSNMIHFSKMHGLGNDYIYVNVIDQPLHNPSHLSILWSDRHTGIGSDGLILIGSSEIADFSMRIFNADGSEALMCGNGTRCVGRYLHDKGLTTKTEISLETLSGIKIIKLNLDTKGNVDTVTVDMGLGDCLDVLRASGEKNKFIQENIVAQGTTYCGTAIDMGNPHLVLFVPDATTANVAGAGSELEISPLFPNKVNVEFAQVIDKNTIRMRVWERGSGITQACGTGACATAVAAAMAGYTDPNNCKIIMDGGALEIAWNPETKRVLMTGTATMVFDGTIELPE